MATKEELSGRERVRLALEHRETDRIPIAQICGGINEPARTEFDALLRRERGVSAEEYLLPLVDICQVGPEYVGPDLPPGTDHWGVHRREVSYGPASYLEIDHCPLAGAETPADLDRHTWPSTEWFDYSAIPARIAEIREARDRAVYVVNGNIFESSWYMRGFEQMFVDLVTAPELAAAIMTRVTDFLVDHFRRMLSAAPGEIELAMTADDIAGQSGLLMSLEMWEEHLKPHHVRLNEAIHELGVRVIYHSDGAVTEAVPGLVDAGIDVLQALQFSADGMDPGTLKGRHGDDISFEGGVSVQTTLPFGTPGDVRAEVEELIAVLGAGGGYILGPSHAIQAGTPPANVLAMFEAASSFYPF